MHGALDKLNVTLEAHRQARAALQEATQVPDEDAAALRVEVAATIRAARDQLGSGVPIFVSAAVDRTEVWVGQPVVWTFQVLRSVDLLSAPKYLPPSTPGFVALPLPQRDITSEIRELSQENTSNVIWQSNCGSSSFTT